jgi:hypothetical protein
MTDNDCRDPRDARIQKLEERQSDMIHKAELRELIKEWEEFADVVAATNYSEGVNDGVESCAERLREVIEAYE